MRHSLTESIFSLLPLIDFVFLHAHTTSPCMAATAEEFSMMADSYLCQSHCMWSVFLVLFYCALGDLLNLIFLSFSVFLSDVALCVHVRLPLCSQMAVPLPLQLRGLFNVACGHSIKYASELLKLLTALFLQAPLLFLLGIYLKPFFQQHIFFFFVLVLELEPILGNWQMKSKNYEMMPFWIPKL